ncbi:MAG: hypothetical protein ACYC8T_21085 [Myxococcaceae bacterium]
MSKLVWVAVAVVAVGALSSPPRIRREEHSAPLLPRPELLKVIGAGYLNLVADYYWIQCVHSVGEARTASGYLDVYYYAELATTLDPDFDVIYRVAGNAIPHNLGRETWVNTKESTAILEKGLMRFPDEVRLRIPLSFNYSYFHRDYARAGEVLEKAVKLPGAPKYLGALLTRLYAKGGRMDSALLLARSMFESEQDPDMKAMYQKRIVELESERVLQHVDKAVASSRDRTGTLPASVAQLIAEGYLTEVPVDPLGGEVFIDDEGVARTTAGRRMEVETTEASGP